MSEVRVRTAEEKPNYRKTAAELLERCRAFYADPENDRDFREWKAEQERRKERVG